MKKTLITILILLVASFAFSNCSSNKPRFIEEDKLMEIITDAVLTNALRSEKSHLQVDTLDNYAVILQRAGYTMEDMKYTISQMAQRKSSPLENIFSQIYNNIAKIAEESNFHYRQMQRYDSTVTAYITDTLFRRDSILFGLIKEGDFEVIIPSPMSGKYTITFDYITHGGYSSGLRQLNMQFSDSDTSDLGEKGEKFTSWIHRSFKERKYDYTATINSDNYDTLKLSILESKTPPKNDSSWINNIVVTYVPHIERARRIYLRDHTGLDMDSNYYKAYDFYQYATDSLTSDTLALGPILR